MQQTTLTAWALPYDLTLFYTWYRASLSEDYHYDTSMAGAIALAAWIVFSKCTKLMPHFVRHPEDTILLLPVVVVFGYVHGLIKFWGLVTLNAVSSCRYPAPPLLVLLTRSRRPPGAADPPPIPTTPSEWSGPKRKQALRIRTTKSYHCILQNRHRPPFVLSCFALVVFCPHNAALVPASGKGGREI